MPSRRSPLLSQVYCHEHTCPIHLTASVECSVWSPGCLLPFCTLCAVPIALLEPHLRPPGDRFEFRLIGVERRFNRGRAAFGKLVEVGYYPHCSACSVEFTTPHCFRQTTAMPRVREAHHHIDHAIRVSHVILKIEWQKILYHDISKGRCLPHILSNIASINQPYRQSS